MRRGLQRTGQLLTRITERYTPDAWVIAVLLTLVVAGLALTWGGATPLQVLDAWGQGFWKLLTLAMQFVLIMITASACAAAPTVRPLLTRLASLPDPERPWQAVLLMGAFSVATAYLNWAFNLVASAIFVGFVAERNRKTDFRVLVAASFIGIATVWHGGLSGTAPLLIATPDSFLIKDRILGEPISTARTLFTPFNLGMTALVGAVTCALAALLTPPVDEARLLDDAQAARLVPRADGAPSEGEGRADGEAPRRLTPAERLDRFRGINLLCAAAIAGVLVRGFWQKGSAYWTIDAYNFAFLGLALVLHPTPRSFLDACEQGIRTAWGIAVQFPFYAGIFGLVQYTPLAHRLTEVFAAVSAPRLYPLAVYGYSAVLNLFIPSGGSKLAVEAPYLFGAAKALGVSPATTTLAYSYGDSTTNFLQPFWAIPLLSVARLKFGDVLGYTTLLALFSGLIYLLGMLVIPLTL